MSAMLTSVEETFSYDKRVHLYRIEHYSGEIYEWKDKIFEREKNETACIYSEILLKVNIRMKPPVLNRILKHCEEGFFFFFYFVIDIRMRKMKPPIFN